MDDVLGDIYYNIRPKRAQKGVIIMCFHCESSCHPCTISSIKTFGTQNNGSPIGRL
jgi:hypothetical protein